MYVIHLLLTGIIQAEPNQGFENYQLLPNIRFQNETVTRRNSNIYTSDKCVSFFFTIVLGGEWNCCIFLFKVFFGNVEGIGTRQSSIHGDLQDYSLDQHLQRFGFLKFAEFVSVIQRAGNRFTVNTFILRKSQVLSNMMFRFSAFSFHIIS